MQLEKGTLLIAAANLLDPNFKHTVTLICEHNENGSCGLVLNRPLKLKVGEVLPDLEDAAGVTLLHGGPVGQDSIQIIHRVGHLVSGSIKVCDDVYWGGNYETIGSLIESKTVPLTEFRFFLGYAGWGPEQLDHEMEVTSWYLTPATSDDVFSDTPEKLWRHVLRRMGKSYKAVANFPDDPQLN